MIASREILRNARAGLAAGTLRLTELAGVGGVWARVDGRELFVAVPGAPPGFEGPGFATGPPPASGTPLAPFSGAAGARPVAVPLPPPLPPPQAASMAVRAEAPARKKFRLNIPSFPCRRKARPLQTGGMV